MLSVHGEYLSLVQVAKMAVSRQTGVSVILSTARKHRCPIVPTSLAEVDRVSACWPRDALFPSGVCGVAGCIRTAFKLHTDGQ